MFGKVSDQFNEVFSRFVPNFSVWFEFYITAKEQKQEIVSIQNLFFLKNSCRHGIVSEFPLLFPPNMK